MTRTLRTACLFVLLAALKAGLKSVAEQALPLAEEFGADMRVVRASQGGEIYLQVLDPED